MNLSVCLGGVERQVEALAAIDEAVGLRLSMVHAGADETRAIGRPAEALAAIQKTVQIPKTVQIRRALAEADPDAFLPDLAISWVAGTAASPADYDHLNAFGNPDLHLAHRLITGWHSSHVRGIEDHVDVGYRLPRSIINAFTADARPTAG